MAIVFKVGQDTDFPAVPYNFPQCGDYVPRAKEPQEHSIHYKNYNSSEISEIEFQEIDNDLGRSPRLWTFDNTSSFKPSMSIILAFIVFVSYFI